jgi:hypothetical protein
VPGRKDGAVDEGGAYKGMRQEKGKYRRDQDRRRAVSAPEQRIVRGFLKRFDGDGKDFLEAELGGGDGGDKEGG